MLLNRNIYRVEYNKLIKWLMPVLLRKPVTMAWLTALVRPVLDIYDSFSRYKDKNLSYKLQITPQVCYLEKLLNDWYDIAGRGIYITDGKSYDALPLYRHDENKRVTLFTKNEQKQQQTIYTKSETGSFACDFIIFIPSRIIPASQDAEAFRLEIGALVDSYKLASKIYKIQIY